MGHTGELEPGQALTVPSHIEGKPVVSLAGTYGKKAPNYSTTPGTLYGTFTLPDTLQTIKNVDLYGFTGTLIIPESVTSITSDTLSGIGIADIEELIINANIETFDAVIMAYYKENRYPYALKKLVIGEHIKYFTSSLYGFKKLETVEISNSVQFINASSSSAIFYLKRFNAPVYETYNTYPVTYAPTGETTDARGLAIGLAGKNYAYTNTDEQLPVEQLFIQDLEGFSNFDEGTYSNLGIYYPSKPGLVAGYTGTVKIKTNPINATNLENILWTSSNPNVATVTNGQV